MRRLWTWALALALAALVSAPALAQDETLADIRQELSFLFVDIQRLKRELSTTGGVSVTIGGTSALERIDLIEAEMVRLTARTEELENRINRVVLDATNRIGDLEFRLIELEGGDVSQLGVTTTLGGDIDSLLLAVPVPVGTAGGTELAVREQSDFDRARAALEDGQYADAAQLFAGFSAAYADGPLSVDADYFRGEALFALGDTANAARAFLESYSRAPESVRAPDALFWLGVSVGELGQISEACFLLGEVWVRFPVASAVSDAASAMLDLGCP